MLFPGILLTILTFPGIIVHEMAHKFFCDLCHVHVHKVCYFRLGKPAGYVLHDEPANPWHQIPIALGPFLLNSLVAILIGLQPALHERRLTLESGIWYWLGISIAMQAFPSTGDARSLGKVAWSRGTPILLKLLALPLVITMYLVSWGSVFRLDLAYGVFLTVFVAKWLLPLLPH